MKKLKAKFTRPQTQQNKKPQSKTQYLVKRIIITNLLSLLVVTFAYFWVFFLISNVNSFWDIFRSKNVYEDKDTIPPIKPYINPIPEASQADYVDVTGRAETGVKISLYIDGNKGQEAVTDNEGQFSFSEIPISTIPIELYVSAKDDAGNESVPSEKFKVQQDKEAPEIEITDPKDGETIKGTERTYQIKGTTEPKATVVVNEQIARVSNDGTFIVNIRLEEGWNSFKIKATDIAGNQTEADLTAKYEKIE